MGNFSFYDLQPKVSNFSSEVLFGLGKQQKQIPPKFFPPLQNLLVNL
jgi:hypothetical protein